GGGTWRPPTTVDGRTGPTSLDWAGRESPVRSHRARTAVAGVETERRKAPVNEDFLEMERAGFEPAASDLQTHPITRPHLTPTNEISMTEPKSAVPPNVARHRSTGVRSHRART